MADTNDQGKNSKVAVCRLCDLEILKPGFGTLTNKKIVLPVAQDTEEVDGFWQIVDMFHFENIGFLRATTDYPNFKFLTCAGCEREVLGVQELDTKNIFLATSKVKYL